MENKKRKWERDYEKYSTSTELNERLEELEGKLKAVKPRKRTVAFDDGTKTTVEKDFKYEVRQMSKEEYDEYQKLTAIKTNLPKVKNILELRGKLEEQRKEINEEIARRELIGKYDKAIKVLEDEMTKLEEEKNRIEKEIKAPDLKPEKKAELQSKLAENEKKRQENNVKFGTCHEKLGKENKNTEQSKFKDATLEDLKNETVSISSNISQCNLACNKLMQGYSWQSIEAALDKYQGEKLKATGKEAAKMKQNREAAKAANAKGQQAKTEQPAKSTPEAEQPVKSQPKVQGEQEVQEENAIANLTMWQKARNWAKTLWGKLKEQFSDEEEIEQEEAESQVSTENKEDGEKTSFWQKIKNWFKGDESNEQSENQESNPEKVAGEKEPSKQEQPIRKEDSFRQYLRDVAEKGIDGVEKEKADAEKAEKEAKREAAKQKLEANRAAAIKREAERDAR